MTTQYLTTDEVLVLHQKLIDGFGGLSGVRDMGALESALFRPQLGYYETLHQQAAALIEGLANNHPFIDGNKRVAFFTADTFLRMNGHHIVCDNEAAYKEWMTLFEEQRFEFTNLLEWLNRVVKPLL